MAGEILYERHGPVRLITIDRADQMNSLDFAANDHLTEIWREFAADDEARAAVITGAGEKAFCAGADLKTYTIDYATRPAAEFRERYTDGTGFGGITRGLDIGRPIVAAINGYAKEVMLRTLDMPVADALKLESRFFYDLGQTEDIKEGTTAFREKRPVNFKGR